MKFVLFLIVLAAPLSAPVGAEEWRYRSSESTEALIRDEGLLARSGSGFLQIFGSWALRRGASGDVIDRIRLDSNFAGGGRLLVLPDQGWLMLARINFGNCEILRYGASGQRLWRSATARADCGDIRLHTDARGGWLVAGASDDYALRRLQRLRADGELVPLDMTAAGQQLIEVLSQREDGSFDFALVSGAGLSHARLIGNRIEQVRLVERLAQSSSYRVISSDGSLWLTAKGVDGDPGESLLRFDAEGRRQWRVPLALEQGHALRGLSLIDENTVGVVSSASDLSQGRLRTIDHLGRELARVSIEGRLQLFPIRGQSPLRPAPVTGAITLGLDMQDVGARTQSYSALGELVPTPLEHGGRAETSGWPTASLQASALPLIATHAISATHVDVLVGQNGAQIRSLDLRSRELTRVEFPRLTTFRRLYPVALAASDSRVCVSPISYLRIFDFVDPVLSCMDRASGQPLYRLDPNSTLDGVGRLGNIRPISALSIDSQQRTTLLALSNAGADAQQLVRLRVSSDGSRGEVSMLAEVPSTLSPFFDRPPVWRSLLQSDGATVFAYAHPSGGLGLVHASADGATVQVRLAANEQVEPKALLDRGAGGSTVLVDIVGPTWARNELWLIDLAGRLQHRLELGDGRVEDGSAMLMEAGGQILVARDALWDVAAIPGPQGSPARKVRVRTLGRIDPLSGRWLWQRSARRVLGDRLVDLKLDAASGRAVVLADRSGQPRIEVLDLASGESLDLRSLRCPKSRSCVAQGMSLDGNGQGRLLAQVDDEQLGQQIEVVGFDLDAAQARPGVPGLAGLWFAPESTGQGLVLSVMPNAQALLGGWFTYTESGENRAADQRWYALETVYSAGTTGLNFELLRSAGGSFAVDGESVREPLGEGELYLRSCSEAVFRYRFSAGEEAGLAGEIPLLRLGPGGTDCAEPAAALADSGGFSLRQSGAWYEPAQSGQGLVMEVLPPAPGSPGLLSAGWFTFDPQGAANDPHAQHWFLVQGAIPANAAGKVELPIFNAIGGRLDSGATRNVSEVGRATLQFSGCDRAELSYEFGPQAGAFAGRSGQLQLWRLAGCAAP